MTPLVEVNELKVHFDLGGGGLWDKMKGKCGARRVVKAVDGVSLNINPGEILGLVGESGCGKTTLGRAILRLVEITSGEVRLDGADLSRMGGQELRATRRRMQMVFQDPYSSLNPRMTIGNIISEPMDIFGLFQGASRPPRVAELMGAVGLSPRLVKRYPHELSGGQQQRVGIARALSTNPDFLVLDEPISALDVSIQAQIMNLLAKLGEERSLTYLFISHDLRAIRHLSDRVAVMYLGKVVELADAKEIYNDPLMPYTKALISAVPIPDPGAERARRRIVLEGDVASAINPPSGCPFHTRCPWVIPACKAEAPKLVEIKPNHFAACGRISPEEPHLPEGTAGGPAVPREGELPPAPHGMTVKLSSAVLPL